MVEDAQAACYQRWSSLPAMFFDQADRLSRRPLVGVKEGGRYRERSWGEIASEVASLARGLRKAGVVRGDRVVLVSENRPEFLVADLAIMAAGAITVPAYTTNTVRDHQHVIENSGARAAIVSSPPLAAKVIPAAQHAGTCETVIVIEPMRRAQESGLKIMAWSDVLATGAAEPDAAEPDAAEPDQVRKWVAALGRQDTACIIYTSGTGGAPKGVMLSHGAILANCFGAYELLKSLMSDGSLFLSFLPLSHSYEHTAGQFLPLSIGARIYYAEGVETLGQDMVAARPTLVTAVPRLYEILHRRITAGIERERPFKKRLFQKTLELGRRAYENPAGLSPAERLVNRALGVLVRRKVRARFGGRLEAFVSGGAPLSYDIAMFFTALGVRLLQGYGQTEAAPVVSCNPPADNRIGTVGPPIKGAEVRIAADGEILVRGELVMQGYWRNPEATQAALEGGWLHTGDVGVMNADGYIRITDRKKDIIVNSGGDNVSPARVEGRLTLEPEIAQAMVVGDRRPYLAAIIVPDAEFARAWAAARDKPGDLARLADDPQFVAAVGAVVERVNRDLSAIERVRRFRLAPQPFAIDNAQLTPTLKVRRHKILEAYASLIESMYAGT
ncbi:MAG: long-chain fatty acid--CoA ligase [Alphaproteobacteria bacterium]